MTHYERSPKRSPSLEPYLGDGVASKRSLDSVAERDRWYQALGYEAVADAHHEWLPLIAWDCPESKNIEPRDVAWHDIRLPGWYKDRGLAGFRGEDYHEKNRVPASVGCGEARPTASGHHE